MFCVEKLFGRRQLVQAPWIECGELLDHRKQRDLSEDPKKKGIPSILLVVVIITKRRTKIDRGMNRF